MRHLYLLLLIAVMPLFSGCHCCKATEHYADCIDDISDCNMCFDHCYCEKLDLTRLCMNRRCCRTYSHPVTYRAATVAQSSHAGNSAEMYDDGASDETPDEETPARPYDSDPPAGL